MSFHIEKVTYYDPMFLYTDVDIIFYSFFFLKIDCCYFIFGAL